jgi:hypothetical protein
MFMAKNSKNNAVTKKDFNSLKKDFGNLKKDFGNFKKYIDKKFATKSDLNNLKKYIEKRFATKEDLKRFATKDDLKRFATKDDLKRFATKDDLKQFATKDDLKQFATKEVLGRVANEVVMHTKRFDELEEKVATKDDFNKIYNMLDIISKNIEEFRQESVFIKHGLKREEEKNMTQDIKIGNLEIRVEKLEKK